MPKEHIPGYKTACPLNYNILKEHAQKMKANPTEAEKVMWIMLKQSFPGIKFRRQHVMGDHIADFACLKHRLVIEIDGGYHNESEQQEHDRIRTEWLNKLCFNVIRFTNEEVICSPDSVIKKLKASLPPTPLPQVGISRTSSEGKDKGE